MGRYGPAPAPTQLRLLRGDRKSRINTSEPRPLDADPVKPGWLSPLAAEEWDRIAADLGVMRTARRVDSTALAAYCEAVARLRKSTELAEKSGPLLAARDGSVRKNPAVAQARDASYEVRMWAREFGFTPSARSPLKVEHVRSEASAERLLS